MKTINQKSADRHTRPSILLTCLVLAIILCILPITAYAEVIIPDATSQFYVNDFADVFTAQEEAQIMETAVSLAEKHDGIQIVITTVKSLDGIAIDDYATKMYNKYGIGKNDMGLLVLLSTGDREIWVTTGKAMEIYINDAKAGRFIDKYAIPYLAENQFNKGLINLQEAYAKEIISCIEKEHAAVATVPKQNTEVNPKPNTGTALESEKMPSTTSGNGALLFTVALSMTFLMAIIASNLFLKKRHQNEISRLEEKSSFQQGQMVSNIATLTKERDSFSASLDAANQNITILQQRIDELEDFYTRACKLHPGIDAEISEMIASEKRQRDMDLARNVDRALESVIELSADKDNVNQLWYALSQYNQLTRIQQSYVTCDVSRVEKLYEDSLELQKEHERNERINRCKSLAATAVASVTAIIAGISIGKARHLSTLKRANSIYNDLDSDSKNYFDRAVYEKLKKLLEQAKADKKRIENEEAAARRKQQTSSRSSTSYRPSTSYKPTSHRGFGGRTGGGGAGRKF